ncbi:hypothetical protein RB195_011605 [Necator americanus]
MSTLRGCKARLTNAINNLTRLVNSANSNYPTVFHSDAHPAVQLRTLQRRIEDMGNAKISIEIALETFQQRHEHAISFIENRPNAIELMDAFDIYWRDHKGDEMEPTATATIFALDDLIRKENELADMLRTTISASTTPQYNPTNTTDEPMDVTSIRNPTLTPPHMSGGSSPPYPAADTMNVQLRKVELPTFDGDFSTYYDFWAKFKTAVHDNPSLSTAAKFIHLSSSLKEIRELASVVCRRFIAEGHVMPDPSMYPAAQPLRDTSTSLSLKKLIRSKFPRETQLEVNRMEHRPLLSISDTSSSPHVLRPIDFVSPQVELQLPSPHHNPLYISPNRLSEWYKETLAVLNNFWDIWYKDYLSAISARHQHRIHQGRSSPLIPSVGDVVLIADKNVPRGQWPLAIITTIHRTKSNIPRSATVRIANGHELQRSINQLHPLEISAKEDPRPKKSRQQLQPTRIQPPRAAKRVRFALGTKRA